MWSLQSSCINRAGHDLAASPLKQQGQLHSQTLAGITPFHLKLGNIALHGTTLHYMAWKGSKNSCHESCQGLRSQLGNLSKERYCYKSTHIIAGRGRDAAPWQRRGLGPGGTLIQGPVPVQPYFKSGEGGGRGGGGEGGLIIPVRSPSKADVEILLLTLEVQPGEGFSGCGSFPVRLQDQSGSAAARQQGPPHTSVPF
jgi:hypothetical protein